MHDEAAHEWGTHYVPWVRRPAKLRSEAATLQAVSVESKI